jgi:ABC-type multidrug transport system fused ATPase/permease subunit
LIERFYDADEGEVLYNGVDLRTLNVAWYRSRLSYVGQEPTLFSMTIAENIAFGMESVSRAEIEEAAKQVSAGRKNVITLEGEFTSMFLTAPCLASGQCT